MLNHTARFCGFGLVLALAAYACSSDDSSTSTAASTTSTTSTGAQGGAGGGAGSTSSSTTSAGGGGASTGSSGAAGSVGGSTGGGSTGGGGSSGGRGGAAGSGGAPTDGGAGSGGSRDGGPRDGGGDATSAFSLTSTAIMEGGMFPAANTCTGGSHSPPFAWTAGPAATMSYAIVLTDKSFNDYRHWVLWDIPAATMSLPADLPRTAMLTTPMGAKQVSIAQGYAGPCPPTGTHTYEFALYAIDVATLPGVTTNSQPMAVVAALSGMHQLAKTTLTAQGMM